MGAFSKLNQNLVLSDEQIDEVIKEITKALSQADVNVQYVLKLRNEIKEALDPSKIAQGANKRELVKNVVIESLIRLVDPGKAPFQPKKGQTNVIMFVGLQGSGKTTTVAKYAKYYKRRGYKAAVVCADTFRAGAFAQLQQNAKKVGVPFYGEADEKDPLAIAERGVNTLKQDKFDLIIVDTSGRHKQSAELLDEMEQVAQRIQPNDIILVMDSSIGLFFLFYCIIIVFIFLLSSTRLLSLLPLQASLPRSKLKPSIHELKLGLSSSQSSMAMQKVAGHSQQSQPPTRPSSSSAPAKTSIRCRRSMLPRLWVALSAREISKAWWRRSRRWI